ncbi:MAG: hypothetical protein MI750_04675, partial [Xanthomonadales bacterium]|nr:hypothetical protein [Xanthomonadales bacterium]
EALRQQVINELDLVPWRLRPDANIAVTCQQAELVEAQTSAEQEEAISLDDTLGEVDAHEANNPAAADTSDEAILPETAASTSDAQATVATPAEVADQSKASDQAQAAHETRVSAPVENLDDALPELPCCISLPAVADDGLRRVGADIMHVLQWYELPYQRLDMEANAPLPAAPAVCFVHELQNIQQDPEGRLLIPAHLDALAPEVWKPQVWAYLQRLMNK